MAKVFHSLITSIDIGTTKISVLIAQKLSDDQIVILGIGKAPSYGLDKGVVVDIEKTVESIKQAVKEAELMAGCLVTSAYIGISGSHIQSFNTHGAVPIKRSQVQPADIKAVLETAQAISIEEGQKILHALPQYFRIDGKDRIANPLGLHGVRLDAAVHIITGSVASMQNLIACCELAGITIKDIVLEQLASAAGVLNSDELALGVGMLDIGGGTSDFAIYQDGTIRYTKVVPIAGNYFTKDLAIGLQTTVQEAERIKREYGDVSMAFESQDKEFEIAAVYGNAVYNINKQKIDYILHARAFELFKILQKDIQDSSLSSMMTTGLVLTGGGSLLKGIDKLASSILSLSVRRGEPRTSSLSFDSLQNPIYATGYGLLKYALQKNRQAHFENLEGPIAKRIFAKMKTWVENFF
ncbi:cell division protein FtsA [Candidatus Dependentiae bacterium]|nr:cell division protein FtsA [Candidatus Dependentiae bacterium]